MWNANSIVAHQAEFLNFIETNNFAATLISETFLTPKHRFVMANHSCFRSDRPTRGGGTAIVVQNNVKHFQIHLPKLESIEAIGIQIETSSGPLRLISAYLPPNSPYHSNDIDLLLNSNLPTLIAGDLNSKSPAWNSRTTNFHGKLLLKHSLQSDFSVAGPSDPTHYPANSKHLPDVLDIIIFKNLTHSIELETLNSLNSDHNPVAITIGDEIASFTPSIKYNYRKANWKQFRLELDKLIDSTPVNTVQNIETAVANFTTNVFKAVDVSVPKSIPGRCSIYDLPFSIKKSIAVKNRARRIWQKFRTPDLKRIYETLRDKVKTEITEFRSQQWEQCVGDLKIQDNSVWQMARRMTNKKEPSPPLQGKTHLACSPRDKAEVLADTLEESFQANPISDNSFFKKVESEVIDYIFKNDPKIISDREDHEPCSAEEVIAIIKTLKNKKAPGSDQVNNNILKELSAKAGSRLVEILNACLKLQHFPQSWKEARVVVFPKPGKSRKDPNNYRPISLLSSISKILERLLLRRMESHATEHNIIINQQFGFRKKHSTLHQLLRVTNFISQGFNINKATGIIFLDVSKAFDRVWHLGLLHKLISLSFPPFIINIIRSYIYGRSFYVSVGNERSGSRLIKAGVPQGSIIGPFLFNIFTNDIPTDLPNTHLALYADDAAIMSQSFQNLTIEQNLQSSVNILLEWYQKWRIALNNTKTTATLFQRKRPKNAKFKAKPSVTLDGSPIVWQPSSQYLGVTLDSKLNFKTHISNTRCKVVKKMSALYPLFTAKSMPIRLKIHLYKTIIRPVITYACPIWSNFFHKSKAIKNKIQILQNKALKLSTFSSNIARTEDLHRDLNVEMLHEHILKLNQNFFNQLADNPNPLINSQITNITNSAWDIYPRPIESLNI